MKRLIDCGNKLIGKLVSREDLDMLVQEARALEAEGLTPVQAERQAVRDALDQVTRVGEDVLRQIRAQRPQAYRQASDFWNKETIRKAGMVPPPLPRFVTEGMPVPETPVEAPRARAEVPSEAIVTSHNTNGGSTVNAVHGDLAYTNSFSVSIFPDLTTTVPGKNITPEQVNEFAAKVQALGIDTGSPNISIGTWYDTESDTTFIDVAFTTTDRAQAIALGQQFNQKAIFDLNAMSEIATGGTGTAEGGLPSIEERLGMASPVGYVPSREAAQAAPVPAAPAPAEGGLPRGEEGGLPEAGRVQEEGQPTEPDQVAPPLSDAAQATVNSLPDEQRTGAQKAFTRDDTDPYADHQRRRGEPVSTRKDKPVAPEKNTKLIADASRYGLFDKTPAEIFANIANDPKQPRWIRLLADLFVQLGLTENLNIRAVNTPEAVWAGLYVINHETGKAEVLINLSYGKNWPDLARRLLHETMHHATLIKLEADESSLQPAEVAAKRELERIFDYVRSDTKAFKGEALKYGASGSLREFVSEIFANADLRARLNAASPDGKVSLWQRFVDSVRRLLGGGDQMRQGSLLEAAIREALNVAGSPRVETTPRMAVAAQADLSRAARLANAFPGLQEKINATVAPMAAEHNMGISKADQVERATDYDAAFYAPAERKLLEPDRKSTRLNSSHRL